MAEKRPLCLYTGNIKQLQPGDTILGAYNATEAGWIVNASGWLVATPGSTKCVDRTVCGTITPVTSGGVKIVDNNDGIVLYTAPGTATNWDYVALGSAARPQYALHLNTKGSGGREIFFTNDTTGHGQGNGLLVGLDSSEQTYVWNYENTKMYFGTNNLQRMAITAGGVASIDTLRSGAFHGLSTASIDTNLKVGGTTKLVGVASINSASLGTTTMTNGAVLMTDEIRARDSGGLWLQNQNNATGLQIKSNGDVWMTGNASIDGNLVVGGTGAFSNSVTITADVQVAAGQKFYMDGGTDTYWTASNDIITGHVNSASVVHFKSTQAHITTNASVDGSLAVGGDLTVTGTLVVVATAHIIGDNIIGDNQTDTQTLYGNILVYNDAAANPMRVTGNASVSGNIWAGGTLGCAGNASMNGTLTTGGDVSFGASINDSAVFFGNASVNGNLVVGGTGAFSNTVTITQDVQVDAGRYLYLDGGLDTYLTATLDVITLHAGTASAMRVEEGGVKVGSPLTASSMAAGRVFEAGSKGTNAYLQLYNTTTGYGSTDGMLIGPNSDTTCYLVSYDSPWTIWASGSHVATWANTGLTLAEGDFLFTDGVKGRDGSGVSIYDDGGNYGIWVRDGGKMVFGPISNAAASFNGVVTLGSTVTVNGPITHDKTLTQTGVTTANANVVVNATVLASAVIIGGAGKARLVNCSLNASGDITADGGIDLMLNSLDDTSPDQEFIAEKVWNAVYNDVVDWQDLREGEQVTYGKVYADSYDGAYVPTGRCVKGVMGICSDTFGFAVGRIQGRTQIPVSVAGWCLAYVDQQYETGEPLTNTSSGCLTSMNASEKALYPERLVAVYKRPEHEDVWQGKVEVKGRHWVQVK